MAFEGPSEYYSDAAEVNLSPFGVTIEFGLITNSPGSRQTQCIVRLSPQHAVVLTAILRNHLRMYLDLVGPISLPGDIREQFDIGERGEL